MGKWLWLGLSATSTLLACNMPPQFTQAGAPASLRLALAKDPQPDAQPYARDSAYRLMGLDELAIANLTVDSELPGFQKGRMLDADRSSAWVNGGYRNALAWVNVELTSSAALAGVGIKTGPSAAGTQYDIQVSTDGTTWTTVLPGQTNASWGVEIKRLPAGTQGRSVRVLWHNSAAAPQAHFGIFELFVTGTLNQPPPGGPSSGATPAPATSALPTAAPGGSPLPMPSGSNTPGLPSSAPLGPSASPGELSRLPTPLRLISVKGASASSSGNANAVADGDPATAWNPGAGPAPWVSVQLSEAAIRSLVVAWDTAGFTYLNNGAAPRNYTLLASTDSTDGSNGKWTVAASIVDNPARSRADTIQAPGARWIRLTTTSQWNYGPALRRLDVYAAAAASRLNSWLILGDSITAQAFDPSLPTILATTVNGQLAGFAPILIGGGTGGDTAGNGVVKLAATLPLCPPGSFVGLAYGTNDATQGVSVAIFKTQLQQMVESVVASGRTPMIARTPYDRNGNLPAYVMAIDEVTASYHLFQGPNLYQWFKDHPEQVGPDSVHPTRAGDVSIQRLWGEAIARAYGAP